ncbi:MAG: HYR domain-containing protein [Saprospiraceae bacterium]
MNKYSSQSLFSGLLSIVLFLISHLYISAQINLTATGGSLNASYTTLTDAFVAINAGTHTGTITINVVANTTEPATGAVLNASGTGSANYTSILIQPSGGAARVISGAINAGVPMIDLNGADNVTFNGLNSGGNSLTLDNTTVSATSGTSTVRLQADATSNLFTNININGASTMATGTNGGNVWIGAGAINTGNDNNSFVKCKFGPSGSNLPAKCFYGNGTTTNSTLYNSNIIIDQCEFFDFFNVAVQSNAIYMTSGCTDWQIMNSKFYQTATRTQTTAAANIAIQLASVNINNTLISGNTIGYANASGTGVYTLNSAVATTFVGISVSTGTGAPTSIQGNTIASISNTTSSGTSTGSGVLGGISLLGGDALVGTITGNTIGVASGTGSLVANPSTATGAIVGINAGSTGTMNIQNNVMGGFNCTSTTATVATAVFGITVSAAALLLTVNNNTIGNATANNMVAGTFGTSTGATVAIGINATSVPTTGNYTNNTIQNFTSNGSGTGNARGIFTSTTAGATTVQTITGNTVKFINTNSALTSATSGLTAGCGIHIFPGTNSVVSNNLIFGINGLNTGAVNTVITGISTANATTPLISYNKIYDITNASTATSTTAPGVAAGITIRSGTTAVTIFNNMISLGTGQTTNTAFVGIWGNYGSSPNPVTQVYFNSIRIDGVSAAGNAQPTFGFLRGDFTATTRTVTVDLRNNIFDNARTGANNVNYAIGNNYNATVSTTGWGAGASNYNVLNAAAANIGWWTTAQTFAGWKTASACDALSYSGISVTYTNPANDLHLNMGVTPTVIESGGIAIAGITDDYDKQVRPGPPGSLNGGGILPDIGADEFDGVPLDVLPPTINYTPLVAACGTSDYLVSNVNIIDVSGVPITGSLVPRIYYRKNAGSWVSQPGTLISGTSKNGFWNFTIVVSTLGGVSFGDVIDYYIIAQDVVAPTNIGSNPAGVVATDVNTIITPPAVPNSITVNPILSGNYTVGAGGSYATLTAAAAAYNVGCLSGPVTFTLIDDTYGSETYPITFKNINATSSIPLTIKPLAGKNPVFSGTSASAIILFDGADYITLDGSNGNTVNSVCPKTQASRNVTIMNNSTSTTSAVVWIQWSQVGSNINSPSNIKVLNCNITGNAPSTTLVGIGSGSSTISATTLGFMNNNISVINNNIKQSQFGIISIGQSAGIKNLNNIFNLNDINTPTPSNVQSTGIIAGFEDVLDVSGNNISGMNLTTSPDVVGINVGFSNSGFSATSPGTNECTNVTIKNNIIGSITNSGTFSAVGIGLGAANSGTNLVSNNMISGVNANSTAGDIGIGIVVGGGTGNIQIYHNTVNMQGAITGTTAASQTSACLGFTSATVPSNLDVRNNIFTNTQIGNTSATLRFASIALGYSSTVGNYAGTICDNNALFCNGAGPGTYTLGITGGVVAGTSRLTLADWRTETGKDLFSVNLLPTFVSTTDLHLTSSVANACLNQTGKGLAAVPSDIDCMNRSAKNPDIGADEFTGVTNIVTTVTENSGIPNDKKICSSASVTISVSGGVTHKWNTGETTSSITKNPTVTTIYSDTLTTGDGCLIITCDTVFINPAPNVGFNPVNPSICSGNSITITASGGVSYFWNTGDNTATITKSPTLTTTYTVTVTDVNTCTATGTNTVTVLPLPNAGITPNPASVCIGKSITLTASGGGTYLWSTGETSVSITKSPVVATTYTVTVTGTNGCTAVVSRLVTINSLPTAGITPSSQNLCLGKTATLTGTGGGTYVWSTGETTTSIVVAPTINTTYTVTVTNSSGCTATATATVAIINPPTLSFTKVEPTSCTSLDGSINMTVSGGIAPVTYSWTGPGGYTSMVEDPTGLKVGNYNVTVTSGNGCTATGSVVLVGPGTCNTGTIIADPCVCKNNATTLQNGQFDEQVKVTASSGQTWTLVSNSGLYLTTSPPPPAAPVLIPLNTVLLESPAGSGNYILNGIHVDSLGFSVTVTNGTSTLSIGSTCYYPNPTFMSLDTAYCKSAPAVTLMSKGFLGNGTNLPVGGTSTYMVDGVGATQLIPANLSVGQHVVMGNFDADSVNVTNPGCIQKMTQNVQINALGTVTATRDTNTCAGRVHPGYVFSGTPVGMVSFTWRKTSAAGGSATTIAASGSGNIPSFTATNSGCGILTDTIFVTPFNTRGNCAGIVDTFLIRTAPTPTANQIRDTSMCNGQMWTPPAFSGNCTAQTIYRWVKKPGPGGTNLPGLASSGTGNLPKLTIVNAPPSCLILTDTIITTPIYPIAGSTDSCFGTPMKFIVKSVPMPVIVALPDVTYCANQTLPGFTLSSNCTVTTQRWRKTTVGGAGNSGTNIPTSGTGNIPGFTTINPGFVPRIDTIITLSVFISVGDSCVGTPDTFLITVLPTPNVFQVRDTSYCSGIKVPAFYFAGNYTGAGIKYNWTRTGIAIGLAPLSGVDSIPMFMTMNTTAATVTEMFTVTPVITLNGVSCSGPVMNFKISVLPAARAVCKNATIYIDNSGSATLNPSLIDNGSVGGRLSAVPSSFTCLNLGANAVTLVVTDPCGNTNTCVATVTVLDTIRPVISCKDVTINLQPGECDGRLYYVPTATDNCGVAMVIAEDTVKYGSGKFIHKGVHTVCYMAMDASGNVSRCCSKITVLGYQNATNALACEDQIQISLDQNCRATVTPDMVLTGGPYKCYEEYVVRIQLWTGGGLIDRDPNTPGVQLDSRDIGKELKITIVDTATGNSCWSHATVEDKLAPVISCVSSVSISCAVEPIPANTGTPVVTENCGGYSLSYRDDATQGSCAAGYQELIIRTWTAVDAYGNRSSCVQRITVRLGDMFDVEVPRNYDNIDLPALRCDEKVNRNKDVSPHMSDYPECVDGYILDSVYWRANAGQPDIYPNRRLPRVLGWNCLDDSTNLSTYGHPSPEPVYYPQHRQWSPQNPLCWGPNRHVMWLGTGKPSGAGICRNLNMVYDDVVLDQATPGCDAGAVGCYKVLRQWTVLDWCTSTIGGHNQIIKVADLEGPQVIYPDSARVNMESFNCTGRWEVPKPWLLDNCSNTLHYGVETDYGTITGNETDGYVVLNMPEGIYNGYIVATDCCGNITKKRVVLNVVDRVPPQAVCRTYTTVSVVGNQSPNENIAKICAGDLDEGSYDNCQPHVWFKMIRMSELLGTNNGSNANNVNACNGINGDDNAILAGNQIYFDDCSYFCCADVGTRVMVVLRVFDVDPGAGPVVPNRMTSTSSVLNGRFSDCMVEVEVQNKSVPTVIAPPNIVVSCSFWFDVTKLSNPNDATFGKVVTDLTNRRKVVTQDIVCAKYCQRNVYTGYPGYVATNTVPKPAPNQACDYYHVYFDTAHPDTKYELVWGFDGYVINSCGTPNVSITVNDLRECGQGQIQRVISTVGPNNLNVSAIQTIWVVDCDPFIVDDSHCNDAKYTDLIWPNGICTATPVTLDGCGADVSPDNPQLGRPQVVNGADDNCALISIEYKDEIFNIEPDACYKILRTWTVIDWCQYDPFISASNGRWTALQVIKVRDKNKPVVECVVGDCEPAVLNNKEKVCYGHISLTASATDNCTPQDWLSWEYKVDLYNDGKGVHGGYDTRVGTLTRTGYAKGDTVEYSHNPYADDRHNPFNASGTYPVGVHKICWFVEDGCGNVGVCCQLFTIRDCKAPTPYCATGVITVPMPTSGCIDIWAKDLDRGSYDNCTAQDKLKFYFDGDPNKTSIRICCQDFIDKKVNDELIVNVEMWVEDEEGNKDYCKTIIIIQDNNLCPNVGSAKGRISGQVMTEKNEEASPVDMRLYMNGAMIVQKVGSPYSFGDLDLRMQYIVEPERNDDPLNGVSTQDIVAIQKHILGKEALSTPYKLIAADVNNSRSISSADIAEIRKLILGTISEFSKVKSWTFVPMTYKFANPEYPFEAPRTEDIHFSQTQVDESKTSSFMAIKLGDVTTNARAKNVGKIEERTNQSLKLEVDEMDLQAGQEVTVNFRGINFEQIEGYQFSLKFDNSMLSYVGSESSKLTMNETNFGERYLDRGILTTSWNSNRGESSGSQEVLFRLKFRVLRNGLLSHAMMIGSDVTPAQAYNSRGEVMDVVMQARNGNTEQTTGIFELYQNEPNPFNKVTTISYRLPESGAVKLTVYDVTGKVLRVYSLNGHKGMNQYQVSREELGAGGVLYYQLDAAHNTATRKMIVVE